MTQTPSGTAVQRMRELRKSYGMSAAKLAEEMTKAGVPWKREIVSNLENGRREYLTVEELLALAVVLTVPPTALLTDSTQSTAAITPHVEAPLSHALLWYIGEQPLHGMSGAWMDATVPVRLVRRLREETQRCLNADTMLRAVEHQAAAGEICADMAADRQRIQEAELTSALTALSRTLLEMRANGMTMPTLVEQEQLTTLAADRGITLEPNGADE